MLAGLAVICFDHGRFAQPSNLCVKLKLKQIVEPSPQVSSTQRAACPVRVYYEDTDCGGVVYHTAYLRFMERARTEWLRTLGFEQDKLAKQHGIVFVVQGINVRFQKPAVLDDLLEVTTAVEALGYARVVFAQTVERAGQVLAAAAVTVACLELASFKPVPIPTIMRATMESGQ